MNQKNEKKCKNNKVVWAVLFVIAAALSIWAVCAQAGEFSIKALITDLRHANVVWLCFALLSMFGFIIFEALAIKQLCEALGYPVSYRASRCYSAADIYFSAITPSASGGQPACALLMMKNNIPASVTTAILLLNLVMYSFAILVIGLISFVCKPMVFLKFGVLGRWLIVIGYIVQIGLCFFLFLLIRCSAVLHYICKGAMHLLVKFRLLKNQKKWQEKLDRVIKDYSECSALFFGKKKLLVKVFFLNFFQRASQISVTLFMCLAVGVRRHVLDLWAVQSYSVIGSNCVPIPGAIGVSDYLMLNGFQAYLPERAAVNLELLSRSTSFYCCILFCGLVVLFSYVSHWWEKRKD